MGFIAQVYADVDCHYLTFLFIVSLSLWATAKCPVEDLFANCWEAPDTEHKNKTGHVECLKERHLRPSPSLYGVLLTVYLQSSTHLAVRGGPLPVGPDELRDMMDFSFSFSSGSTRFYIFLCIYL
jgi:hypothetical protein